MASDSPYVLQANELYNQIISEVDDDVAKEKLYSRHDEMCMCQYSAEYQHWSAEQFAENNAIADALLEIIVKKHGPYVLQN